MTLLPLVNVHHLGIKMYNFPRGIPDRRGVDHGGVAVIYKEILSLQIAHFQFDATIFEHASVIDPIHGIQYNHCL